jgi:hypothetical protein
MTATLANVNVACFAVALAVAVTASVAQAADPGLRNDLDALARRTVFFGHQSVGMNILDGIRDLAAEEGTQIRIVEAKSASVVPPGTVGHAYIGENGKPDRKVKSFDQAFAPGERPAADIAFMKFCYVDFDRGTDVKGLFQAYQSTLRTLQERHSRTTFVHLTVPLTTDPGGVKSLAKRMLGRETPLSQNARREEFNALLRKAYAGREPLFDLARIESTSPDGKPRTVDVDGMAVPVLVEAYSDDGGHLNAVGRRRVARELVAFLAALRVNGEAARAEPR